MLPKEPVIWASNHALKDDAAGSLMVAKRHALVYYSKGQIYLFFRRMSGIRLPKDYCWISGRGFIILGTWFYLMMEKYGKSTRKEEIAAIDHISPENAVQVAEACIRSKQLQREDFQRRF